MKATNGRPHFFGATAARFGASAGPLSLLLLPKCPLCLVPLLALLGLAIPAATGLWIAYGVIVAVWLTILFSVTRARPRLRAIAFGAAAVSFIAVALHLQSLLWVGVLLMGGVGIALSRICATCARNRTVDALTHASPEA